MGREALEQAIDWLALLRSGEATAQELDAFAQWQQQPANAQAWERVERHLQNTYAMHQPKTVARQALLQPNRRRQLLQGALVVAGLGITSTWLLPRLGTDDTRLHTATGERRRVRLEDGSELILAPHTRVELAFNRTRRLLHLQQGQVIAEVARDRQRPFIIRTPHGQAEALGTRFALALEDSGSSLWVQESRVRLQTLQGIQQDFSHGQGAWFDAQGIHPLPALRQGEGDWADGWLSLHDRPLAELARALAPYHHGVLRLDADAARLRVSGRFNLDDSRRTLEVLAQTMPIHIRQYLGFWWQISAIQPREK